MGTYGHICKPIDVQDVLAVIEKALHMGLTAPTSVSQNKAVSNQTQRLMPTKGCCNRGRHPFLNENPSSNRLDIGPNN
jgi:hypothetical protein